MHFLNTRKISEHLLLAMPELKKKNPLEMVSVMFSVQFEDKIFYQFNCGQEAGWDGESVMISKLKTMSNS